MTSRRLSRILLPPAASEALGAERIASLASLRTLWVIAALVLDLLLYAVLRRADGLRAELVTSFCVVNVSLMLFDLGLTQVATRRRWAGYRAALFLCVLSEVAAAVFFLHLTGSVSSYFLVTGFLLVMIYRLLVDYATGLFCALAFAVLHTTVFALEAAGVLRPAALFLADPVGIYEVPLFRLAAMLTLDLGYLLTFVAMNFFVATLREKEVALRAARLDLARAVDETGQHGRLAGARIDGWQLDELIGSGGMGDVYRGHDARGQAVAIKVLHVHLVDQREMRERFRREAELVARVPDRFVARVLDVGATEEGQLYIVMEYLRGQDLAALLRRRERLPLPEVVSLLAGMAAALEAAHDAGVIHRDLKPQNVFVLDEGGGIRLLDFGIARLNEGEGLTVVSELLGTAGYMAPEQARGSVTEIGTQTDVFALAAIVYRALTGVNAFPSRSTAAAVYEAIHLHPPPPSSLVPGLPVDVDHVLAVALAKRPADRYTRAAGFASELARAARADLPEATRALARRLADEQPAESVKTRRTFLSREES